MLVQITFSVLLHASWRCKELQGCVNTAIDVLLPWQVGDELHHVHDGECCPKKCTAFDGAVLRSHGFSVVRYR